MHKMLSPSAKEVNSDDDDEYENDNFEASPRKQFRQINNNINAQEHRSFSPPAISATLRSSTSSTQSTGKEVGNSNRTRTKTETISTQNPKPTTTNTFIPLAQPVDMSAVPRRRGPQSSPSSSSAAATYAAISALESFAIHTALGLNRPRQIRQRLQPQQQQNVSFSPPASSSLSPPSRAAGEDAIIKNNRRRGTTNNGPTLLDEEVAGQLPTDNYSSKKRVTVAAYNKNMNKTTFHPEVEEEGGEGSTYQPAPVRAVYGQQQQQQQQPRAYDGRSKFHTTSSPSSHSLSDTSTSSSKNIDEEVERNAQSRKVKMATTSRDGSLSSSFHHQEYVLDDSKARKYREANARIATRLLRNKIAESEVAEEEAVEDHQTNKMKEVKKQQFIPPPLTSVLRRRNNSEMKKLNTNYQNTFSNTAATTTNRAHQHHGVHSAIPNPNPPYGFAVPPPVPPYSSSSTSLPAYTSPTLRNKIYNGTDAANALGLLQQQGNTMMIGANNAGGGVGGAVIPSFIWGGGLVPIVVPGPDGAPRTMYLCESPPTWVQQEQQNASSSSSSSSSSIGRSPAATTARNSPVSGSPAATSSAIRGQPPYNSFPPSGSSPHAATATATMLGSQKSSSLMYQSLSDDVLLQLFVMSTTIKGQSEADKLANFQARRAATAAGLLAIPSIVGPHGHLHGMTNDQALRLLKFGGTSSSSGDAKSAGTTTTATSVSPVDIVPSPYEMAAGWASAFDAVYSKLVLTLPKFIAEAALGVASVSQTQKKGDDAEGGGSKSGSSTSSSSTPPPLPLGLALAVASPLHSSLQDVLMDVDVVTLVREAVAGKIQERIASVLQKKGTSGEEEGGGEETPSNCREGRNKT